MQLTSIYGDGIKKADELRLDVPKLLGLTGPIGTGKTTTHQLITLAVLGYDPALGRTLAKTRELSSGRGDILTRLGFDSGFGIRRSFGREIRTEVFPPRGERTEKEMQARIDQETGGFMPSFDLGFFLALSAEKRREALFQLLPRELLSTWSQETFRHYLGYAESGEGIRGSIDRLWFEQVEKAQSPVEGLASALEFIQKRFLEAENERQRQETVAEKASRDAEAVAANRVAGGTEELTSIQVSLSVIEQRLGELRERKTSAERARRRESERQERVRNVEERVARGAAQVATLNQERESLAVPPADELKRLADAIAEGDRKRGELSEQVHSARLEFTQALGLLGDLTKQRDLLVSLDQCPTCGSVADLTAAREKAVELAATQRDKATELKEVATRLDLQFTEYQLELTGIRQTREQMAAIAERSRKLTFEIGQNENLLKGFRQEKERLEAEVNEIPDVDVAAIESEMAGLEDEAAGHRDRIRLIQQSAESVGAAQATIARADKERRTLDAISGKAKALKEIRNGLQRLRGFVIQQMVEPVEKVANELLQEIDPAKTFEFIFERESKDTFDFGFRQDGAFRGYDAASKGEDALLGIVFVAALIAAVNPRWRLLRVDNIEAIDDISGSRRNLMEALVRVSDRFDNVIISGCCELAAVQGWTIVDVRDLRRERANAAA